MKDINYNKELKSSITVTHLSFRLKSTILAQSEKYYNY